MRSTVFWLTVAALCERSLQLGFARPFFTQFAVSPGSYGTNMVWTLGDVELVEFDTPWPEYRIEFWQQSLVAGAKLSNKPVYQREKPTATIRIPFLYAYSELFRDPRSNDASEVQLDRRNERPQALRLASFLLLAD